MYYVRLSDGRNLRLYRQTLEDFALCVGRELTEQELEALLEQAGQMSAKMRAVRIVSASSVSRRDLEQRLVRKGENPEQARAAVEWMEGLNLVDDRQTARQLVQRCASRGYGLAKVKQTLYEKQIPKSLWEEVLEDYPDQSDKIRDFLRSKLPQSPDARDIRRVTDALLRRGHSYGDVRRALNELEEEFQFREET